ncbi:hypothetical protein G4X40_19210 [Rhodococcus sp. D2-41]|uniref:DUF6508 domain-containing protein n=1 Tax=Speluncibacter jeojiensis TaxID=2710754 RepID=A0A9X4M041_9ACTN|nr:DUF6508 domain-containing protein [Rhodococcus sp. D2-41]MDG3012273.1 hypothetical protein [Rhodococcus sp. D2-41]MDG3014756.1 DUF6508 domain-containing protein [Corynebacteriales bacterium D3-21]
MTHDTRQEVDPFAGLTRSPERVVAELTSVDWADLQSLVERVNAHSGAFGSFQPAEQIGENHWATGYPVHNELVREATQFVYERQLVLLGLNWTEWDEGQRRYQRGEFIDEIAQLDLREVLAYITMLIRADRFSEGALLDAFDRRVMPALLNRLLDFKPRGRT